MLVASRRPRDASSNALYFNQFNEYCTVLYCRIRSALFSLKAEAALFELQGLVRQLTPRSPSLTPQTQASANSVAGGGAHAVITLGAITVIA